MTSSAPKSDARRMAGRLNFASHPVKMLVKSDLRFFPDQSAGTFPQIADGLHGIM